MIPTAALRQRITVEPFLGESAYGPTYGTAQRDIPARVVGKRRAVRKTDGTDVISTASISVRPTIDVPVESRVTCAHPVTGADETFEVLDVLVAQGLTRPDHLEMLVG